MEWLNRHKNRHNHSGSNIRNAHGLHALSYFRSTVKDSPSYKKVYIGENSYDTRMLVEKKYSVASGYRVMKLLFEPFYKPRNGQLITIDNEIWLSVYADNKELAPFNHIRKCNYLLSVEYNKDFVEVPVVIDTTITKNQKLSELTYVDLSLDTIKITVPYNNITKTIYYKDRFIIGGTAWEIQGINSVGQVDNEEGIIEMSAKKVPLTNDEIEELSKEEVDTTVVTLHIEGGHKVEQKGKLQLTGVVTYDGKIIEGGKVEWSSEDGVIDENGLFIATCDTGDFTVTAKYEYVDGCGLNKVVEATKDILVYNNKEWW